MQIVPLSGDKPFFTIVLSKGHVEKPAQLVCIEVILLFIHAVHSTECCCLFLCSGDLESSPLPPAGLAHPSSAPVRQPVMGGDLLWWTQVQEARSGVEGLCRRQPSAHRGRLRLRAHHASCWRNWEWGWWEGGVPGVGAARGLAGGDHLQGRHLSGSHCHRWQLRTALCLAVASS